MAFDDVIVLNSVNDVTDEVRNRILKGDIGAVQINYNMDLRANKSPFYNLKQLRSVPFDIKLGTNVVSADGLFYGSGIATVPEVDFNNVRSAKSLCEKCYRLKEANLENTQNIENLSNGFKNCKNLFNVSYNSERVQHDDNLFDGCYNLEKKNIKKKKSLLTRMSGWWKSFKNLFKTPTPQQEEPQQNTQQHSNYTTDDEPQQEQQQAQSQTQSQTQTQTQSQARANTRGSADDPVNVEPEQEQEKEQTQAQTQVNQDDPINVEPQQEEVAKKRSAMDRFTDLMKGRVVLNSPDDLTPDVLKKLSDPNTNIKSVVINYDMDASTSPWAYDDRLKEINYDISFGKNVKSVDSMFAGCENLEKISGHIDTRNIENFSSMFEGCSSIKSLPSMNTSNAINITNFAFDCSKLENVPTYNFAKVKEIDNAFALTPNLVDSKTFNQFDTWDIAKAGIVRGFGAGTQDQTQTQSNSQTVDPQTQTQSKTQSVDPTEQSQTVEPEVEKSTWDILKERDALKKENEAVLKSIEKFKSNLSEDELKKFDNAYYKNELDHFESAKMTLDDLMSNNQQLKDFVTNDLKQTQNQTQTVDPQTQTNSQTVEPNEQSQTVEPEVQANSQTVDPSEQSQTVEPKSFDYSYTAEDQELLRRHGIDPDKNPNIPIFENYEDFNKKYPNFKDQCLDNEMPAIIIKGDLNYNAENANDRNLSPFDNIKLPYDFQTKVIVADNVKSLEGLCINQHDLYYGLDIVNTKNVENWSGLYQSSGIRICPNYDTSGAKKMGQEFFDPEDQKILNGTGNLYKVNRALGMFTNCQDLHYLPDLDTSKVENLSNFAFNCQSIKLIPEYDLSKAKNLQNAFRDCIRLNLVNCKGLDNILNDVSKDLKFSSNFDNLSVDEKCNEVTNIANNTPLSDVFRGCEALDELPIKFETKNVYLDHALNASLYNHAYFFMPKHTKHLIHCCDKIEKATKNQSLDEEERKEIIEYEKDEIKRTLSDVKGYMPLYERNPKNCCTQEEFEKIKKDLIKEYETKPNRDFDDYLESRTRYRPRSEFEEILLNHNAHIKEINIDNNQKFQKIKEKHDQMLQIDISRDQKEQMKMNSTNEVLQDFDDKLSAEATKIQDLDEQVNVSNIKTNARQEMKNANDIAYELDPNLKSAKVSVGKNEDQASKKNKLDQAQANKVSKNINSSIQKNMTGTPQSQLNNTFADRAVTSYNKIDEADRKEELAKQQELEKEKTLKEEEKKVITKKIDPPQRKGLSH